MSEVTLWGGVGIGPPIARTARSCDWVPLHPIHLCHENKGLWEEFQKWSPGTQDFFENMGPVLKQCWTSSIIKKWAPGTQDILENGVLSGKLRQKNADFELMRPFECSTHHPIHLLSQGVAQFNHTRYKWGLKLSFLFHLISTGAVIKFMCIRSQDTTKHKLCVHLGRYTVLTEFIRNFHYTCLLQKQLMIPYA